MRKKAELVRFVTAVATVAVFFVCLPINVAFGQQELAGQKGSGELVFELEEVSVFDVNKVSVRFTSGHRIACELKADPNVKYPAFKSDKPLYGLVRFDMESGEEHSGTPYHFAIDESEGAERGYDRLYFDLNRDLDLTNDVPLASLENPPKGAILDYKWIKQQVCFDYLSISSDSIAGGKNRVEVMPRLVIPDKGTPVMSFVATKARKGQIKIAGQRFDVLLGQGYPIGTHFDRPSTEFHLILKDLPGRGREPRWWGADMLKAIHKIGGTYYRFSTTAEGDKLTVKPYDGEFGIFEIGSGWRLFRDKQVRGSLWSKDATVAVGTELADGELGPVQNCTLPIGDYAPAFLTINYGPMLVVISDNYHSDGKPRDRGGRPQVYGIKIRKDKPFVLDFANKPEVMFASPAKDCRLKPGEQLNINAVLIDPKLDIMIRNLEAKPASEIPLLPAIFAATVLVVLVLFCLLSRRLRQQYRFLPFLLVAGAIVIIVCFIALRVVLSRADYEEITPQVLIARSDGETVNGGTMPFG